MSTPAPDLGVANYTGNWFDNPGLELWDNSYWPTRGWYTWANGDSYRWLAQAPYPVQQGSKSGGLQCRGQTYSYGATAYWLQSVSNNLAMKANDVNVTFYWYLDQNPDPGVNCDYFRFYTRLYSGSTNYYMYYYLNGTTSNSNSSSTAYFLLDGPTQTWNRFSRNISADYDAMVTAQGWPTLTAAYVCPYARFHLETRGYTTQYLRAFVDNVYVKNTTYTWIGGSTRDGDFEDDSDWGGSQNTEAGFVRRCSTAHTGSYSANLTASSTGNYSYGYLEADVYPRATALNQVNLSFWWYLDYQGSAYPSSWSAYMSIYVYNGTGAQQHWFQLRYYLGDGYAGDPSSNSSNRVVYDADAHNTTGSWVYFNRNIWADLTAHFNLVEAWYDYCYFQAETYAASKVTLLIDSTRLNGAAVNGGDFEDQLNVGDRVHAWDYPYVDGSPYLTVTDTCYSGSKAANLTVTEGTDFYQSQYINRPLNGSRETYLDLAWYLDDYTEGVNGNYAYLRLYLRNVTNSNEYYLFYGMAIQQYTFGNNGSSSVYFNVTGVNTLDTWHLMHRDLVHDFESWFGFIPNVEIFRVQLCVYTVAGGWIYLLLDDFYIYDDPAPVIGTINQVPSLPDHNEPAHIIVTHIDEQDLDTVLLHYRTDGGGWQTLPMPEATSYDADIPGQPALTFVEYYVTANDTWGMTTTDDNSGSYYSYIVDDSTPPSSSSVGHTPLTPTYDTSVTVSADLIDAESGIKSAVLYYRIDGGSWNPVGFTHFSGDTYHGTIPAQVYDSYVEYYIYYENNAERSDQTGIYDYTVDDLTDPVISNIAHDPTSPEYEQSVLVSCEANDAGSGIASVQLTYRVNGGTWTPLPMPEGIAGHYSATIPSQAWNTLVEYYITATDGAGNPKVDDNTGSYYSYTVGDDTDPSVAITAPTDGTNVTGTVTITATASDLGSAIHRVEIYIGGTLVSNDTSAPFSYSWDTTSEANGDYIITVTAYDNAGNSATDSVTVTVDNVTPTPTPTPFDPVLLGGLAAAVIIIVVVVILLLWYFVLRKRK